MELNYEVQKDLGMLIENQNDLFETSLLISEKNKKISGDALTQIKIVREFHFRVTHFQKVLIVFL